MSLNSIAFRLIAAAAISCLVVLPIAGFVLNSLFYKQLERNFDVRLEVLLSNLIAESIDEKSVGIVAPKNIGAPEFLQPLSGWYWQITPLDGTDGAFSSNSLTAEQLGRPSAKGVKADAGGVVQDYLNGPVGEKLRVRERIVDFGVLDKPRRYSYAVAGSVEEIDEEVTNFTYIVSAALTLVTLSLLAATFLQVRFGLDPLRKVERGLGLIRTGEAERLEGEFPDEITSLQDELNALIQSNQDIIERSRTQVGNLAHALKTPLSVITNEAGSENGKFASKVSEQANLMRDQINHYLDRARMAARVGVIGGMTEVEPVAAAMARALRRIYQDRGIRINLTCPDDLKFRGERQDLEEMLGNLMDNACIWAEGQVDVTITSVSVKNSARGRRNENMIAITIEDDGPGLSEEECLKVLKRGKRLDETKPGSGLGLSIVEDLSSLYKGSFKLDRSKNGGLRARLQLPMV